MMQTLIFSITARDIQRGEDFPFAAFNAKNFASTISPWVVTLDALEPFKIKSQPRQEDDLLPYLADPNDLTWDIPISMNWKLAGTDETFVATSTNLFNTYWTFKQMVSLILMLYGCVNLEADLSLSAYFPLSCRMSHENR
jgi:fumarylacetoacetase